MPWNTYSEPIEESYFLDQGPCDAIIKSYVEVLTPSLGTIRVIHSWDSPSGSRMSQTRDYSLATVGVKGTPIDSVCIGGEIARAYIEVKLLNLIGTPLFAFAWSGG